MHEQSLGGSPLCTYPLALDLQQKAECTTNSHPGSGFTARFLSSYTYFVMLRSTMKLIKSRGIVGVVGLHP
jgi:hypothetical protein